MVEEHDRRRRRGSRASARQRVVELAIDPDHVAHRRTRQPLAPGLLGEPVEDEAAVLTVDLALRADGASQQLRRVAAAGAELGDAHSGTDAGECEQLVRLAPRIERAVGGGAIGRRHDGGVGRRRGGRRGMPLARRGRQDTRATSDAPAARRTGAARRPVTRSRMPGTLSRGRTVTQPRTGVRMRDGVCFAPDSNGGRGRRDRLRARQRQVGRWRTTARHRRRPPRRSRRLPARDVDPARRRRRRVLGGPSVQP